MSTTTVEMSIKGMTCGGCAQSVTTALQNVKGVKEAQVDLEKSKATVIFNDAKTDTESLKNAVEDVGYDVN